MEQNLTRAKLQERTAEVIFLRSVERELRAEREQLSSELARVQNALETQIAANEALRKQLQAVEQSLSWKVTAPLRAVLGAALRFRGK